MWVSDSTDFHGCSRVVGYSSQSDCGRVARQNEAVHQCGCSYRKHKWYEVSGDERGALRRADPHISDSTDKGQEHRKNGHADKSLPCRFKGISYKERPGILHAACGTCLMHLSRSPSLERQICAEHDTDRDKHSHHCALHTCDRRQTERARAFPSVEPAAPNNASIKNTGLMTRTKARWDTNDSRAWLATCPAPNRTPNWAPTRIERPTADRR